MKSIQIKNLRSLKDTGQIDIKPLTILVGKNSSGKSTFLRFFPLMKQSFSTTTNEPILWYDKNSVDFGSFDESLNSDLAKSKDEKFMEFCFNFYIDEVWDQYSLDGSLSNESTEKDLVKLNVKLENKHFDKIEIMLHGKRILFKRLNAQKNIYAFSLDDKLISNNITNLSNDSFKYYEFLPHFVLQSEDKLEDSEISMKTPNLESIFIQKIYDYILSKSPFSDLKYKSKLRRDLKIFMDEIQRNHLSEVASYSRNLTKRIGEEIQNHSRFYRDIYDEDFEGQDVQINNKNENYSNEIVLFLNAATDIEYDEVYQLIFGSYISQLLQYINYYLSQFFTQVHYIAPVRASAQRYYRTQGLAINEIDPRGENIPISLNYLSKSEKQAFKKWTLNRFGFYIQTKEKFGHISLTISFNDKSSMNLTDTGFGFSQILPIILLLWRSENDSKPQQNPFRVRLKTSTIVIEQPELHLHPALQAKLTDVFVNCITVVNSELEAHGSKLNIIIETHSETIINRVGQLIYNEKISPEMVNLLLFNGIVNSSSEITPVQYNEDGVLQNWPLGFFYPEV